MKFFSGLLVGLREIWAHKFRSLLTMLGVILGVSSLVSVFALLAGSERGMRATLNELGGVERIEIEEREVPQEQIPMKDISPGRTMADAEALRKAAPLVALVSPRSMLRTAAITRGPQTLRAYVYGVTQEFFEVDNHRLGSGRLLTDLDQERAHHVAVIGAGAARELWPDQPQLDPVGQRILINDRPFTVVGLLAESTTQPDPARQLRSATRNAARPDTGRSRGFPRSWSPTYYKNLAVAIPISTMFIEFKSSQIGADGKTDQGPYRKLDNLYVRIADAGRFEEACAQINSVLLQTHRGIRDFGLQTREEWFDRIESSVQAARVSGGLIAGVSLIVGGIGITNIMLASISERVREIGIRRAVGATGRDIFIQILAESVAIGVIGGLLGLVASAGMIRVLVLLASPDNTPVVQLQSVLISFSFAMATGILSGLYPAWRAASLDPIEALRNE